MRVGVNVQKVPIPEEKNGGLEREREVVRAVRGECGSVGLGLGCVQVCFKSGDRLIRLLLLVLPKGNLQSLP